MAGRVGRTCEGIVTYLYDVDDSELALQAFPASMLATSVADHGQNVKTLVMASAKRVHYARHTMQHLTDRGFPDVMWLRTPDNDDIVDLDPDNVVKRKLMIMYYTTVLPAVRILAAQTGTVGVYLFEDSCILTSNVTYAHVANEVKGWSAGIFGYARHQTRDNKVDWWGTKGMYLSAL